MASLRSAPARRIMRRCCSNDDEEECGCFPLTGEFECNTDDLFRVVQVRQAQGVPAHYRFFPAGQRPQTNYRDEFQTNFGIFLGAYMGALPALNSFNNGWVKLIFAFSGPFGMLAAGLFAWDSFFSRHSERRRRDAAYVCMSVTVAITWIGLYALSLSR